MELTLSKHDGHVIAHTSGPIDESAREAFREHLHPIVGMRDSRLIIDLSQSTRINSQGLSHLVTLVAHANTSGSRVVLCGVPPFVSVVLSVTRLNQFFELALDQATAVALVAVPAGIYAA